MKYANFFLHFVGIPQKGADSGIPGDWKFSRTFTLTGAKLFLLFCR
jgi:hypothetical protein